MKKTYTEFFCDRCGALFEKREATIIEHLSYTHSGYSKDGDGGITVKDKEFCPKCSKEFSEWLKQK